MSQRLSESAVHPVRHSLDDPYWKTPLGFKKNGQPFFPVGGASPDDGGDDGTGAGGSGEGGTGSGSEGQQGGDGGTGDGADGNKDGSADKVDKSEYEKVLERMKAADRNAAEALKKLKELEEKDLSEQEKVLKRVPELEASVKTLTEENKGLKAKIAFLGLDGFSWHDPDVALGQVDLSEVTKEDGTIDKKALKAAADKLAKDKPFLAKSAQDSGEGNNNGGSGGGGGQGSGTPAGSGPRGNGGSQGLDEAALRKKYPALNT